MTRITVRVEGHYEVHEAPFSRSYEWHPPSVTLVCDCGQELTLSGPRTILTCRCGADHSAVIRDIQEREGRLRDEVTHPWRYDAQEQAQQHMKDDAAYPKDSTWRYNDITSGSTNDV